MTYGFGMGRGMGRGFGGGGGRGFGFRASSPPWPYVGRGRGGLPRCGYFAGGAGAPPGAPYPAAPGRFYEPPPYNAPMTGEDELAFLKDQAAMIKDQLEEIAERISHLEGETPGTAGK